MTSLSRLMRNAVLGALAFLAAPVGSASAQEVTVYGTREAGLTAPILERFTSRTSIPANFVFFKSPKELNERLAAEAADQKADLVIIPDIGGLFDLVAAKKTQPVSSRILDESIPAHLKHPTNMWVGLSYRIRSIYVSRDRVATPPQTYQDLADPQYQGRLCIRSGTHPYNAAWVAAMLLKQGDGLTAVYLQSLKRNLARTASGGDRDVARDIAAGICDVGVANTYYMGLMLSGAGGPEQKKWAEAVKVVIPRFADGSGAHVNISGAAVLRNAPNKDGATRLLEYLASEEGQKAFADLAFEYPVRSGVPLHPLIAGFGDPTSDSTTLPGIAMMRAQAGQLVTSVAFDAPVAVPAAATSRTATR